MTKPTRAVSKIEIEASEWLIAMSAGSVSLDQRMRFQQWLKANPEHERIYALHKQVWLAMAHMPHLLNEVNAVEAANSPLTSHRASGTESARGWRSIQRRWEIRAVAAVAALAIIALTVLFNPRLSPFKTVSSYETAVAQMQEIKLSDGTLITLAPASHIDVVFSRHTRQVVLTRGEAFFEVVHDAARPFVVTTDQIQVSDLGTKFNVSRGEKAIRVAVLEGLVEVATVDDARPAIKQAVTPGYEAVANLTGEIVAVGTVKAEGIGAWRQGHLVYVDAYLRDVVADINRYYDKEIEFSDPTLGDRKLTIAFHVDHIDQTLAIMQQALSLRVIQSSDHRLVIGAAPPER